MSHLVEEWLYFPISSEQLERVSADGDTEETLLQMSIYELCALLVIQHLPNLVKKPASNTHAEKLLASLIDTACTTSDSPAFRDDLISRFDKDVLLSGISLLDEAGISLLNQSEVDSREYLTTEGRWDYEFCHQYNAKLTERAYRYSTHEGDEVILSMPQSQLIRGFAANMDDHLHVQGYAGTGKTHLLRDMVELLRKSGVPPRNILVLSHSPDQVHGIKQRLKMTADGVSVRTFGYLAKFLIPADWTNKEHVSMRRSRDSNSMDRQELVREFDVQAVASFSPSQVAYMCWSIVASFCFSGDGKICEAHIPAWAIKKSSGGPELSAADQSLLAYYANCLWTAIIHPTKSFAPPLREYHRVKYAALQDFSVPEPFTHVIIDESQDISKPMQKILDRSPQAVISLGDEYQGLSGAPAQRAAVVRQRNIVTSVRSGRTLESIVNPIIQVHPGRTKELFEGNRQRQMIVEYYEEAVPAIPNEPAVLLTNDEWGLFEWVQRLGSEGANYHLLGVSSNLDQFVQDCMELHHRNIRARHGALFRYTSWAAIIEASKKHRSMARINHLLARGYDHAQWAETKSRRLGLDVNGKHTLGMIGEAKNREFNTVMLMPDVVDACWDPEGLSFTAGSALYIAVTRAKHKLIAPIALRQWIEEVS